MSEQVLAGGRSVAELLAWSRDLVDAALCDAVSTLPDSIRRVGTYHLGWQDELGVAVRSAGGKAIRPTLVLLAAEAVGGSADQAVRRPPWWNWCTTLCCTTT